MLVFRMLGLTLLQKNLKLDLIHRFAHKASREVYSHEIGKQLENRWRPLLEKAQTEYSENEQIKLKYPKKYVLSMFPYPSGRLHLGHVRVYALSDLLARFYRMKGYYVIHPIGWDSFGLPAENAAIERKIKPDVWTESNIQYMKNQLKELSFSFDWNRELSTCRKDYYKMTQHLFLQMYHKGIVFQKEAIVNWDPVDKTVLANEQIDENGKSWRSGAVVEKKVLKQWFIKSSAYAKSLLDAMDSLSTSDWDQVKHIQKMWIGNCNGCFVDFKLKFDSNTEESVLSVFTEHPQCIYGISHISVASHNLVIKKLGGAKVGEKLPCYAIHPLNGEKIPVYIREDAEFGTLNFQGAPYLDARLGVPSLSESDRSFADQHQLKYLDVVENGGLKNSKEFDKTELSKAFDAAREKLLQLSAGGYQTSDRLNDWCISRQRYWGAPIPLIYCDSCKVVPVDYESLPVELPSSPPLNNSSWQNVECPKCKKPAKRESDTMDTFMDSSWYYLRYLDVNNTQAPFDPSIIHKEMPVDIYIGGIEHAMTHLFVSRLISHFLYDQGKMPSKEPFKRFIAMGMVKGETFKAKSNGRYVQSEKVVEKNGKYYCSETNEELAKSFEKMSKSKLNGIDPQFMIQKYGVDFTRFFLLNYVHPKSDRNFQLSDDMINGALNVFQKTWTLVQDANETLEQAKKLDLTEKEIQEVEKLKKDLYKTRNSQLEMIEFNLTDNFNIPSYIVASSKIQAFLRKFPKKYYDDDFYRLLVEYLIITSPITPHFSNECWKKIKPNLKLNDFDKNKLVVELAWPRISSDWKFKFKSIADEYKI